MPRFDSGEEILAIEYDFSKHGGSAGEVPEPSDGALRKYRRGVLELAKETATVAGNIDPKRIVTPQQALDQLQSLDLDVIEKYEAQLSALTVEVCNGHPPKAEWAKLPGRVKIAFAGFVSGELLGRDTEPGPTSPATDTTASQVVQNGAGSATSSPAT